MVQNALKIILKKLHISRIVHIYGFDKKKEKIYNRKNYFVSKTHSHFCFFI